VPSDRYLLHRWDTKLGQMRLESQGIRLSPLQRQMLEQEIRSQYAELLLELDRATDPVVFRFQTLRSSFRFGQGFVVSYYADTRRSRNPSLLFRPQPVTQQRRKRRTTRRPMEGAPCSEPIEPWVDATRALTVQRDRVSEPDVRPWIAGFLSDLVACFKAADLHTLSDRDFEVLQSVVHGFRRLCEERSEDLPLLLLAGYVTFCQEHAKDVEQAEADRCTRALRALDRLFTDSQYTVIESLSKQVRDEVADDQRESAYPPTWGEKVFRMLSRFWERVE
jgi:hypothetical protein